MFLDVSRETVLVAGDVGPSCGGMLPDVVSGFEQVLGVLDVGIKLKPLLIHRVADGLRRDTSRDEPGANGVDSVLAWSKQVVDLLG